MPPTRQLIRQHKVKLARKRRLGTPVTKWYIGKRQSSYIYYLADFDNDSSTALWSKHKKDGMTFKTERGVHQYISTYLNNRSDIMLIRVSE